MLPIIRGPVARCFLLNNDLRTPYSDQFSIGIRNTLEFFGSEWNSSVAFSHIRSKDGIYFRLGNRRADGSYFQNPGAIYGGAPFGITPPGYGNIILGDNGLEYRLNSLLVSLDKPYTTESGWGLNLAYTYSDAEENRSDSAERSENFVFDFPYVGGYNLSTNVPKHRLVLSGFYDLGWDTTLSGKLVLASHRPREAVNCREGISNDFCFFDPYEPEGTIGFKQFDVALQKIWDTGADIRFRVRADLLNAFNWRNYNQFEGFRGGPGEPLNPNFGQRNGDEILLPTRTFKLSFGLDW